MKIPSMLLLLLSLLSLLSQPSCSTTILVDGVSEWKDPGVYIGDSIIFNHKYHYNLYIFQNQRAFNLCNFTQATLLTKPNSTSYTWHPSRPGFLLLHIQQWLSKILQSRLTKTLHKSDIVSSSPAYQWPSRPRDETAFSPAPAPGGSAASTPMVTVPTLMPDKGGGSGIPFINSNPAVPLPTGEIDSATIRPLPTSGYRELVAVGLLGIHMPLFCVILLLLL
ncbi:hypothetical protein OIU76_006999 [Salix suchowensis]|nr:hypothetical protein OIU76_006999 [Salix suchowensis]